MELAAIIISALGLLLVMLGIAWSSGRKIGTICQRLDTLSTNQGEMVLAMNKTNARVQSIEIAVNAHTSIHKRYEGSS